METNEVKSTEFDIDKLKEAVKLKDSIIDSMQRLNNDSWNEFKGLISHQITQLKAINILFDIMASASTHREKAILADMAKKSMESEIEVLIRKLDIAKYQFFNQSCNSELPF